MIPQAEANALWTESDEAFRKRVESEPLPENLAQLLQEAVQRHGDAPAWIFVDADRPPISWRDLQKMVFKAANAFADAGVVQGTHVGVMLPNVPEFLVAWLAIGTLGARMIPINPGYTPKELEYWLTDGDVTVFLLDGQRFATYEAVRDKAPLLKPENVIVWGADIDGFRRWEHLLDKAGEAFSGKAVIRADDIVNIQYTSGSTGWPKGCLLSHRYWILCGKLAAAMWPGLKRIQCDLPFYYMGPLWRFVMAAFNGSALCVPPAYSLSRFRQRVRDYRYDMAWMTNPVAMLDPDPIEKDHSLTMIATFGMPAELRLSLESRYGVPVRDAFGMTEIGFAIGCRIGDAKSTALGTCGKVLPYRQAIIVDTEGKEVPDGQQGELCIAGPGMLQGYYKKEEATREAFRGQWFRTGDLAWKDENGYFYIIGRIKNMIRRSAENISVTEVESALSTIPEVKDVAVHGVPDAMRGEEVKACLILKDGFRPEDVPPEKVLDHARKHLARFKVPRYVQYYAEFPRTGSNKIAKKRLVDGEGTTLTGTYDAVSGTWSHPETSDDTVRHC
jgi:Acyl-CoA synthetases (AMP-forming)/AMP-acid ligases II